MSHLFSAATDTSTTPMPADVLRDFGAHIAEFGNHLHLASGRQLLDAWRCRAAASVAAYLHRGAQDPVFDDALKILAELKTAGVADYAAPETHLVLANEYAACGWGGVIAAMILVPAWQWPAAPSLRSVPAWMGELTAEYLFTAPRCLTASGQGTAYAASFLTALTDLAALAEANRASTLVKVALEHFKSAEVAACLPQAGELGRNLRSARARLLNALHRARVDEPFAYARDGRKLRVGIVAERLEATSAVTTLLPFIERLDANRFELFLLVVDSTETEVTRHLVSRGAVVTSLPTDGGDLGQAIRDVNLDVAVYVLESAWASGPIAPLCVARHAPLQIVHDGTGQPTSFAGADLTVVGKPGTSSTRMEREAVVPGFERVGSSEFGAATESEPWTKEAMGISADQCVLAVAGPLERVSAETVDTCVRVLADATATRLVFCVPGPTSEATDRFCGWLTETLARHQVDQSRVAVFSDASFASEPERRLCLAAADVLIDLDDSAGPVAFSAAALAIPVLAKVGTSTARLLEVVGVSELVSSDEAIAADLLRRLTTDRSWRESLRQRLHAAAPTLLATHDSLVRSETFGRLLEQAFDAVVASRKTFVRQRQPLTISADQDVTALAEEARFFVDLGSGADAESRSRLWLLREPASIEPRAALARALALQGRALEASAVWLTIVEFAPEDASAWHELAVCSKECGRRADAVQALETALRLDAKRVDSWLLLSILADEAGDANMRRDVVAVLKELAPDDPKVVELAAAVAA